MDDYLYFFYTLYFYFCTSYHFATMLPIKKTTNVIQTLLNFLINTCHSQALQFLLHL